MKKSTIRGAETVCISTKNVSTGVTLEGGHLWPVRFHARRGTIAPMSIAPWVEEKLPAATPPIIRLLRGDFFCLPFGGNATPVGGKSFPVHGESANRRWKPEPDSTPSTIHMSLRQKLSRGHIDKFIHLRDGSPAIYQRHILAGFEGCLPGGHHAMLHFKNQGDARISMSRFVHGQVFPGELESAARGGYSCLKPGATFSSLENVPRLDGTSADLSVYPAREGYEDLVQMAADPDLPFAWNAVTVPSERFVWIALRDPRVLRSTIFWMSNGGRHYAPWSGRHRGVIGIEDVTSFFHPGAAESIRPNAHTRKGIPTAFRFDPKTPTTINHIIAAAEIPAGFDIVRDIRPATRKGRIEIIAASGKSIQLPIDLDFLTATGPLG